MTAAHRPIKEIPEKEKKVGIAVNDQCLLFFLMEGFWPSFVYVMVLTS